MLYVLSRLRIVDNSGGFEAFCICVLKTSGRRARPGDVVVLAVKSVISNPKLRLLPTTRKKIVIKKGTMHKGVVLRTSERRWRSGQISLQLANNCVALLGKWDLPLMNRAKGPSMFEIKLSKYKKFTNICEGLI